jgi:hypothetical protein
MSKLYSFGRARTVNRCNLRIPPTTRTLTQTSVRQTTTTGIASKDRRGQGIRAPTINASKEQDPIVGGPRLHWNGRNTPTRDSLLRSIGQGIHSVPATFGKSQP